MPDLDFSEILIDPDLSDCFSVKRRVETVSAATGLSSTTHTFIKELQGVVTPDGDGNNLRKDDSQMTQRSISVITQFRLRAAGQGIQPDVVVYDGDEYTVKSVHGWHRFGSGFIIAIAESMNAADPPFA